MNAVYCDLCRLRDRACSAGYRQLLVNLWAGGYSGTDPIGGLGVVTVAASFGTAVRAKNLSDAAQHHAGCNFSTEGRWNCPAYEIYSTGNISDRIGRCHSHASCILQGLWMERNLDVSLPFGIGFLQCRF